MANNLHISYDLNNPGQNYDAVIKCIKEMGSWAKIHQSFWYVKSSLTAAQARDRLLQVIDKNDTIYIVDATNDSSAWHNLKESVSKHIREKWSAKAYA